MKHVICYIVATALCVGSAQAQVNPAIETKARAISETVVTTVVSISTAEALIEVCKHIKPQNSVQFEKARMAWRAANALNEFGIIFKQLSVKYPSFSKLPDLAASKAVEQANTLLAKNPNACAHLSDILALPTFTVSDKIATLKGQLRSLPSSDSENARFTLPTTLYTLVQLSVLTETAMSSAAPLSAKDHNSKEARAKRGGQALQALGVIAVNGRVVSKNSIREWRGDQQSTFSIACHSFVDKAVEKRFETLRGQDITITGKLESVYGFANGGGSLTMYQCQILDDPSKLAKATLSEDHGLELRPPEAYEANARPGEGLAPEKIEKVVYKGEFRSMLDGLGNIYMDRDEDTYLLLKDGTAYHYNWPFPPSDLNVALVKARSPQAWYNWEEHGSTLKLTRAGGSTAGEVITLNSYDTLMPFDTGTVLNQYYFYQHIGMGGMRTDRGYTFRADGTGTFSYSGFVAANLGYGGPAVDASGPGFAYSGGGGTSQGHLAVAGNSGKRSIRYRIDGYMLEVTDDSGKIERSFIARFPSQDAVAKHIYLKGQILWSEDDKK